MSSLGCKALSMVISFLICSICLSSSVVHFKNCLMYLTRVTAQVFTHFLRFLPYSLFSSVFFLLRQSSIFFFHFNLCDGVCFQYSKVFRSYLFTSFLIFFLDLVDLLLQYCFLLFIINMAYFSKPNSITMSWLYTLHLSFIKQFYILH